jgi:hypothetical protein
MSSAGQKTTFVSWKEISGRTFWVIGVSAPAVVTGMYKRDGEEFRKGYPPHKKVPSAMVYRLCYIIKAGDLPLALCYNSLREPPLARLVAFPAFADNCRFDPLVLGEGPAESLVWISHTKDAFIRCRLVSGQPDWR